MCNTPVEVQFTSAGCLNYPCRTPKSEADRFARNVAPIIAGITRGGVTSARGIAKALNARDVVTARGKTWTAVQALSIIARVGPLK
jgi:hypothetical protein